MPTLGVQLYSIRDLCAKDLPSALRQMKQIGYDWVEFAGYHNRPAAEWRQLLKDNGLSCCGAHVGFAEFAPEKIEQTIAFHREIGCDYLIVPSIPREKRDTAEKVGELAKWFNDLAARLEREGMRTGYHAHHDDFCKLGEKTGWELLFGALSPRVIMQLDTANTASAGVDPLVVLKQFPHRSQSVHLKEHGGGPEAAIGEGTIAFKEVIDFCRAQGGTERFVVESEVRSENGVAILKRCRDYLRRLGL